MKYNLLNRLFRHLRGYNHLKRKSPYPVRSNPLSYLDNMGSFNYLCKTYKFRKAWKNNTKLPFYLESGLGDCNLCNKYAFLYEDPSHCFNTVCLSCLKEDIVGHISSIHYGGTHE